MHSDDRANIVPLILSRDHLNQSLLGHAGRGFSIVLGTDQQPRITFLNDQAASSQITTSSSTMEDSNENNLTNNESDALLRPNNNTSTTAGGATPTTNNNDQPPLNAVEMRQSISTFYNGLSSHSKFLLPFILLVAVKLLCDYLIRISLMLSIWYSLSKVKNAIEIQMALKAQASIKTLFYCMSFNLLLLGATLFFLELLGYSEQLLSHLILISTKPDSTNIMEVIWNCIVMDMFIQLIAQQCRACICFGATAIRDPQVVAALKRLGLYDIIRNSVASRAGTLDNASRDLRNRHDLESGASRLTSIGRNNLARRPNASGNTNSSHTELVGDTTSVSAQLFHQSSIAEGSTTSDDTSTESVESWDYLVKLKICKCVDILSYIYRSLLPVPLWINFFDHGALSSFNLLTLIYLIMKFFDMSWKMKGAADALDHMLFGKLEYGHYSTIAEYDCNSSSYDCPVCFEAPKVPVTLDCKHIFCEVCIAEWLEKEKTCPVCRSEVKPTSPNMRIVKIDSSSSVPVLV